MPETVEAFKDRQRQARVEAVNDWIREAMPPPANVVQVVSTLRFDDGDEVLVVVSL